MRPPAAVRDSGSQFEHFFKDCATLHCAVNLFTTAKPIPALGGVDADATRRVAHYVRSNDSRDAARPIREWPRSQSF
jgi:hypothetical protein